MQYDADQLRADLAAIGWTQRDLVRWLSDASGRHVAPSTANRWCQGDREVPPALALAMRALRAMRAAGLSLPDMAAAA